MKRHIVRTAWAASGAALLVALAFSALPASPAAAAETVEVRHHLGVAKAPANPKRIVAFDFSILDSIDLLGVDDPVYAIPKQAVPEYLAKFNVPSVANAGGMKEPNLEALYEFQPDVIFISARQTDYYDKFAEIAPTVYANVDYKDFIPSFRANLSLLGDLFGIRDKADAMAKAVADKAAATAARAEKSGKNALVVMVNDGAVSVYGPGSRFGLIHDVLKFKPADPGVKVSTHGQSVDFEYLAKIDPDIIFVINRNAAIGAKAVSKVLDNEIVNRTKAGRTGKIVYLDSSIWYLSGAGLASLDVMIDEVDAAID